jgi:glycerophosphoryl diester phosphodiesterase
MAEVGRPTVMTEDVLQKLEEAFLNGASDRQACFLANIAEGTLYNYIKDNPDFGERKELLKQMTAYRAKQVIKSEIENNKADTAKWYLERKDKEFKPKNDFTSNDETIQPVLVKFLDGNNNNNTPGVSTPV